jgi:photosynthetic reaction center cytochrome c subunit
MNFRVYLVLALAAVFGLFLVTTFEWPSVATVQSGYRGVGMEQVYNRLAMETKAEAAAPPATIDPIEPAGQPASAVYQNVKVLVDVDANEFLRTMSAMTEWVSPQQGCAYCHNVENLADDSMYTHQVSRRMLQMTRHMNADWQNHVGATGVTCYTCHRGQNVPANIWSTDPGRVHTPGMAGNPAGQNQPAATVGLSSLPYDPFTPFFSAGDGIRVAGQTALPDGNRTSIKQTEWTYGLMYHMSNSLGVNCTFCHNSRSFQDWSQSSPQRLTSWYGIRMLRDLNVNYLEPLQPCIRRTASAPGRRSEGELRHLSPGRLQAALRVQHAEGLSGADGDLRAGGRNRPAGDADDAGPGDGPAAAAIAVCLTWTNHARNQSRSATNTGAAVADRLGV